MFKIPCILPSSLPRPLQMDVYVLNEFFRNDDPSDAKPHERKFSKLADRLKTRKLNGWVFLVKTEDNNECCIYYSDYLVSIFLVENY